MFRIVVPLCLLLSSCTVLRVDSDGSPPRIQSRGLIESHIALGIPSESHLLHANLFDGTSDGAIAELTLWKLLHVEVGLAGLSLGLGPLHIGLGVLLYEPEVPPMLNSKPARTWEEQRERQEREAAEAEAAEESTVEEELSDEES